MPLPTPIKGKSKKELFCDHVRGLEIKSNEENLIIGGFIATTHVDEGLYDEVTEKTICDKIDKPTLDYWAAMLNDGNPRTNKVSINHDRGDKVVAGVAKKGSASVMQLPDGEYGLYVESIIDSTHPDFSTTENRIDIGTLDSFSIEFIAGDNANIEEYADYNLRHLTTDTELYGYTLASRPMNEYAVMIKEILDGIQTNNNVQKLNKNKEVITMAELSKKEEVVEEPKEDKPEEPIVEPKPEEEIKEVTKMVEVKEKPAFSDEDAVLLSKVKESMAKEAKENEKKELIDSIKEDLKSSLDNVKIENKVMVNNKDVESKEILEFKEVLDTKSELQADGRITTKISVDEMFKRAGKMADTLGLTQGGIKTDLKMAEFREAKDFSTNGTKMECKGLGLATNLGAIDYLSAAELHDVFDPVIYTALNQATVTWNLLAKDDYSMKGNNKVQFTVKTAANTTASAYLSNAVTTGNVTRIKCSTKFKKYQVGVEVDGDMIAAARGGPIGDVFAEEVKEATVDLLSVINSALFAEVGAETAAGVIGFEYIADSAGNTTLYGYSRSSTTDSANVFLSPSSAGDTFIDGSSQDITLANMRKAKRQALKEGAQISNLVFITDHIQGDKFRGIYDAAQRNMPTSARWGFEGRPEFDGIPIFEDKDCADDDWWLIDLESHRVAVWVPPTLEMLGKDADSVKGFIKTYFATYNRYIRRMVMIYENATT